MVTTDIDVTSRRFNKVWPSDDIDIPVQLTGAEGSPWYGAKLRFNQGRLLSWGSYSDKVMRGIDREHTRVHRQWDLLIASNRRSWLNADGTIKDLSQVEYDPDVQEKLIAFADKNDELMTRMTELHHDIIIRKASYLLWEIILPDGVGPEIDCEDESALDIPELFPILEWAMHESTCQMVMELSRSPKSTGESTTSSS